MLRRFPGVAVILIPFLLAHAHGAAAAPCPACSTLPDCLSGCPAGDMTIALQVVDDGYYPTSGVTVVLDFSGCGAFAPCPGSQTGYVVNTTTKRVSGITNSSGVIAFSLAMGATCVADGVRILADNVELGRRGFSSPDQDGNLVVDEADIAAVEAKIGLEDATADLDCDGVVTAGDVDVVRQHLGHRCDSVTPTVRRTWGQLKILYR